MHCLLQFWMLIVVSYHTIIVLFSFCVPSEFAKTVFQTGYLNISPSIIGQTNKADVSCQS